MKFQKCILINFVTDAQTNARMDVGTYACTDGQKESNTPLHPFHSWGHKHEGTNNESQ